MTKITTATNLAAYTPQIAPTAVAPAPAAQPADTGDTQTAPTVNDAGAVSTAQPSTQPTTPTNAVPSTPAIYTSLANESASTIRGTTVNTIT